MRAPAQKMSERVIYHGLVTLSVLHRTYWLVIRF